MPQWFVPFESDDRTKHIKKETDHPAARRALAAGVASR